MSKLSVAIITYNEETNIQRCIESVLSIADEVVVVDSFSSDNTREIARKLGAVVIENPFEGHIQQKNYALSQTKNDLVLSLDADEALDETLKKSVMKVKDNIEAVGYSFNRLTYYCGKWIKTCGWYPDVKIRLVNKNSAEWKGINPHDKLVVDGKIMHLKGDLLHYSCYTIEQHKKQINFFTDISSKAYFKKGKKATFVKLYLSPIFKFMMSYFFRLGFTSGWQGFMISWLSAGAKYKKYYKLKKLYKYN